MSKACFIKQYWIMFYGVYNVYATFYSYGQVFSIKLIKQAIGNTTTTAFVWKIEWPATPAFAALQANRYLILGV